ncbi:MAG: pyrroline-5-carboxylate reductase family protein, partial [Candidatus Methylomirabilales bacterium]
MLNGKCLGFIGGGNMAEAMIRGLLKAQLLGPQDMLVSDVTVERLTYLQQTFGIRTSQD